MKLCLLLTFLVVFATLEDGSAKQNVTYGYKQWGDQLLFRTTVKKSSEWFTKVTKDVKYPSTGFRRYETIHFIQVSDLKGKGGYVKILSGGVGRRNVTIHLKSKRGEGFKFLIEIWGR